MLEGLTQPAKRSFSCQDGPMAVRMNAGMNETGNKMQKNSVDVFVLGDAIMHRREPDYSNAKYWFQAIGNQPTYCKLRSQADAILASSTAADAPRWRDRLQAGSRWDPFAFVDLCEACAGDETTDLALAARRIQYAEMSMLVWLTCRQHTMPRAPRQPGG